MDILKILAIVFGATGFWKLIEILLQYGMQKRLKQLESKNTVMNKTITKQRDRITELEKYVDQLEAEIQSYKKQKKR